ncbi:hypothetical protein DAMA08_027580 [Martiniozyma asiatica (nom. inval.)]|nr:hypothetical protein DAMA08_027580 [Martiniozyma asiatica]
MTKTQSLDDEFNQANAQVPFGFYDSIKTFFTPYSAQYYEENHLSHLPFYKPNEVVDNRLVQIINTPIDNEGNYIHEVSIKNTIENGSQQRHIILVHGFGASLGFFYKNLYELSSKPNVTLHAIDLLGFGLSSRPQFPNLDHNKIDQILKCEEFFIDSFEIWRQKKKIETCSIVAHSLGGYLMSCWYLKYGKQLKIVDKLCLVSPVGVESSESCLLSQYNKNLHLENCNEDGFIHKVSHELKTAQAHQKDVTSEFTSSFIHDEQFKKNEQEHFVGEDNVESHLMIQHFHRIHLSPFFSYLWDLHYNPLSFIHPKLFPFNLFSILWPFKPLTGKLIAKWTYNRFENENNDVVLKNLCLYICHSMWREASGEDSLGRILAPGSLGRLSLSQRIVGQFNSDVGTEIMLIYGEHDWMDKSEGKKLVNAINKSAKSKMAHFRVVEKSGHHLYFDNPEDFHKIVLDFL